MVHTSLYFVTQDEYLIPAFNRSMISVTPSYVKSCTLWVKIIDKHHIISDSKSRLICTEDNFNVAIMCGGELLHLHIYL